MNGHLTFTPPDLPHLCHACGAGGHLSPCMLTFKHNSANWLSVLALLVGMIYYREMTYTVHFPFCAECRKHRRRQRPLTQLMWFGVFVLAVAGACYGPFHLWFLALPGVALVAAIVYSVVLHRRGRPKVARINNDLLVINVPGHGEVTVFDRHAAPRAQAGRSAPQPSGPRLNRSVCGACGFINFASAVECKKCRAPLGATQAAGAA